MGKEREDLDGLLGYFSSLPLGLEPSQGPTPSRRPEDQRPLEIPWPGAAQGHAAATGPVPGFKAQANAHIPSVAVQPDLGSRRLPTILSRRHL